MGREVGVLGKKGMLIGKYELGRTLGEGNFGKVKFAKNVESGQGFAVKILDKKRILDLKIHDQVTTFVFNLGVSLIITSFFVRFIRVGVDDFGFCR